MANVVLEPIDLYGNWKVTKLTFQPPAKPYGLKKGVSKFKIRNKASKHVLIKKKSVGWNAEKAEIPLTEVTSSEPVLFNANLRLKAISRSRARSTRCPSVATTMG